MGNLSYPLDNQSQVIIERAVDKFLSQKVFEINWNDYLYYNTLFEGLDGWGLTDSSGGSSGANFQGVGLVTGSTSGDTTELGKIPLANAGQFTFEKNQKIRTSFYVLNSISSIKFVAGIGNGDISSPGNHYGFLLENTTLKGRTSDSSSTSTVTLATGLAINTEYSIEAHFVAGEKVDFYFNKNLVGTITDVLPSGAFSDFFYFAVQTTANASKEVAISYAEYIQRRKA